MKKFKKQFKKPNINLKSMLPRWSSKNIRNGSYSLMTAVVIIAGTVYQRGFKPDETLYHR